MFQEAKHKPYDGAYSYQASGDEKLGDAEGFIKKNFATLTGVEILGVNYFTLACELAVSNELSGRLQSGR